MIKLVSWVTFALKHLGRFAETQELSISSTVCQINLFFLDVGYRSVKLLVRLLRGTITVWLVIYTHKKD